jgi:hypothetical protein
MRAVPSKLGEVNAQSSAPEALVEMLAVIR